MERIVRVKMEKKALIFWTDLTTMGGSDFLHSSIGKGGENMALEAIQTVTQAEARAKADREAAAAQAKQKLAEAQREAKQTVEQARQQAREEARRMMAEAESKAAQLTQEELTRAAADCDALKKNARGRLERAAQLIVGRVVER
jgi:V/A-type H+-transporting ATPase subunit G/H